MAFTGATSASAGTVQFYQCALNEAQTTSSNCIVAETGTYTIETINGARLMRFAGYAPTTFSTDENFYTEFGASVYRARQTKPVDSFKTSPSKRLNATAWASLRGQLALAN